MRPAVLSKILFFGTCILSGVVLALIWWASLDWSHGLAGWDNFSVSLNIPVNAFRTLFSSWRAYRGLGVPSDSEGVDIFRIVVQAVLSWVVPNQLIDQVYYLSLYTVGVVGSYFLCREMVAKMTRASAPKSVLAQVAAVVGATMYAFNYHVLETFFLPVAMYPARYAFFPWILVYFIRLVQGKQVNKRAIIPFVVVNLLATTAYLTATVFITLLIMLATLAVSSLHQWRRYVVWFGCLLLLNSFWLLPFANYTWQKASLLPQATSFTSVNEALLNKPASDFEWYKLTTFYPLTMSQKALPFVDLASNQPRTVHDLVSRPLPAIDLNGLTLLPLVLVLVGVTSVLAVSWHQRRTDLWWPLLLAAGTLFLLRKELPPLGFAYTFLARTIPFFAIVFRFGGAKFFPLLLVSFSVLGAIGFWAILAVFGQRLKGLPQAVVASVLALTVSALIGWPFASFFQQGLFSQLVRVSVPAGYSQAAQLVDSQVGAGRVLHLPFDQFSYWKSYNWGYFGSTFLSFMLRRPLLERTFEPASLDNDFYFLQLEHEAIGSSQVSAAELAKRLVRVQHLLANTGTSFVLFDASVSEVITAQQLKAWGVFNRDDIAFLVDQLKQRGVLVVVQRFPLDGLGTNLDVYRHTSSYPAAQTITTATNIDPALQNGFSTPLLEFNEPIIQAPKRAFASFPFWQPHHTLTEQADTFFVSVPLQHDRELTFTLPRTSRDKTYHDLYITRTADQVMIYLQPRWLPLPVAFNPDLAQQITLPVSATTNQQLALKIAGEMLSLPSAVTEQPVFLGSVLLPSQSDVTILASSGQQQLPMAALQLTDNPNCYNDQTAGYGFDLVKQGTSVRLQTQNGMTCVTGSLIASPAASLTAPEYYVATQLEFEVQNQPLLSVTPRAGLDTLQQTALATVAELPIYADVQLCLLDPSTGRCLNTQTRLNPASTAVQTWTDQPLSAPRLQALLIVPAAAGSQSTATFTSLTFATYQVLAKTTITTAAVPAEIKVTTDPGSTLQLAIPNQPSLSAFSSTDQAMTTATGPCSDQGTGYRTYRRDHQGRVVVASNECWSELSATIPADPNISYLWLGKYRLFAGRQPRLLVYQNQLAVQNDFLSRFNRYPAATAAKPLQAAGYPWWGQEAYQTYVSQALAADDYDWEMVAVEPLSLAQTSVLQFKVNQLSEGAGVMGIERMQVVGIPTYWRNLMVQTGPAHFTFAPAQVTQVAEVLPSLWSIELALTPAATPSAATEVLLEFGQDYDQQWQLYRTPSPWLALLGIGRVDAEHVKVKGWANGWILPTSRLSSQSSRFYAVYAPERLAWIGTGLTTLTAAIAIVWAVRRSKRSQLRPFWATKNLWLGKKRSGSRSRS